MPLSIGPFKCYVMQLGVSAFPEKSVTKVYSSMLLALRGGGWGQFPGKKHSGPYLVEYIKNHCTNNNNNNIFIAGLQNEEYNGEIYT